MRTILTTVGTSLITNAKRELNKESPTKEQLTQYLRHTDPVKAAAETNSLTRLLQEGDKIIFFHSETKDGQLCAEVLSLHYQNHRDYSSECVLVKHLNYEESAFKMRGLRQLVANLIRYLQKEQGAGREVVINATGGFKAEIAFATLIGLVFNIPVFYIHEAFKEIIQMPPTPVNWDFNLLAEHEDFFEWLNADLRTTSEVEQRVGLLPSEVVSEVRMLLVEEEEYTLLAPTGEVFWEAYSELLSRYEGVPIKLSNSAKERYERSDSEARKLFDRTFQKLRAPNIRNTHSDRVINSNCLVFPKGHRNERVFWYEENGVVYVCELSLHSDRSYENLLSRGVCREKYFEWSDHP